MPEWYSVTVTAIGVPLVDTLEMPFLSIIALKVRVHWCGKISARDGHSRISQLPCWPRRPKRSYSHQNSNGNEFWYGKRV